MTETAARGGWTAMAAMAAMAGLALMALGATACGGKAEARTGYGPSASRGRVERQEYRSVGRARQRAPHAQVEKAGNQERYRIEPQAVRFEDDFRPAEPGAARNYPGDDGYDDERPRRRRGSHVSPDWSASGIDINSASKYELKLIPGVGEAIATLILENRPFRSWDEVAALPRIGETRLAALMQHGSLEPL